MIRILGIDPGITGALGVIDLGHAPYFRWVDDVPTLKGKSGKSELDFAGLGNKVRFAKNGHLMMDTGNLERTVAVIESAHARPGQGISSTSKYVGTYYAWRTALALLDIACHVITPASWKKALKLGPEKEEAVALAKRLYPECCDALARKKDHGRAEAILIAHYGRQLLAEGKL